MATRRRASGRQLEDFATSFFSDLCPKNMVYATLIRSPVHKGRIGSIVHRQLPKGFALYTAKDLPGSKVISILDTSIPLLAEDEIGYLGEPIAILVGPEKGLLKKLSEEVVVRIHRSACPQDAVSPGRPSLLSGAEAAFEGIGVSGIEPDYEDKLQASLDGDILPEEFFGQDLLAYKIISGGDDAELVFAEADIQVEGSYSYACCSSQCQEPAGGMALFSEETLSLYAPVQWFSQVRQAIAACLNISPQQVEIKRTLVAGEVSFSEWHSVLFFTQLAVAAYLYGKPVMMVLSPEEQEDRVDPPVISYRSAISPDGKILAMIASIFIDAGVYNPFIHELIGRILVSSMGIYNPAVYKIEAYAVRSYRPPSALSVQQLDNQIFFALETHLNDIAKRSGMMPYEVRLANCCPQPSVPFSFDFSYIERCMAAVIEKSAFPRKYVSYSMGNLEADIKKLDSTVPLRGIGMACAFEGACFLGSSQYVTDLRMTLSMKESGSAVIHSYPPSPSVTAIWKRIVAEELNITEENVHIDSSFESGHEPMYPAGYFGYVGILTQLLRKCCVDLQKQRCRDKLPIYSTKEISRKWRKVWSQEDFSGMPFVSTSTGAAAIEVELDVYSFDIKVRGIWIAVEGGEILSQERAAARIKIAVREILKGVVEMDELDAPEIFVTFIPGSKEPKQLGNLAYSLIPGAFAAAVAQVYNKGMGTLPLRYGYASKLFLAQDLAPGESHVSEVIE